VIAYMAKTAMYAPPPECSQRTSLTICQDNSGRVVNTPITRMGAHQRSSMLNGNVTTYAYDIYDNMLSVQAARGITEDFIKPSAGKPDSFWESV